MASEEIKPVVYSFFVFQWITETHERTGDVKEAEKRTELGGA